MIKYYTVFYALLLFPFVVEYIWVWKVLTRGAYLYRTNLFIELSKGKKVVLNNFSA